MSDLGDRLLDLLYPPKCAFCGKLVRGRRMICPDCEAGLPTLAPELQRQDISHLAVCVSPLYYTGVVRHSLHRYKFGGAAAYYRVYAELMAGCLHTCRGGCAPDRPSLRADPGENKKQPGPVRHLQCGGTTEKCTGCIPHGDILCGRTHPAG